MAGTDSFHRQSPSLACVQALSTIRHIAARPMLRVTLNRRCVTLNRLNGADSTTRTPKRTVTISGEDLKRRDW